MTSRSSRATSVSATASSSLASGSSTASAGRFDRAASVATADSFQGYSGYYSRQLALINQKQGPTAAEAAVPLNLSLGRSASPAPTIYPTSRVAASATSARSMAASASASSSSMTASRSVTTQETSSVQRTEQAAIMREHSASLEYGKKSTSRALRRAEQHAVTSGKDPRHTVLPRSLGDDICKVVADLHISPYESKEQTSANASYMQGRLKVDRMNKELSRVTESAMSYKSMWTKSASQMAKEAIEACDMEAMSNKKVRRTVVEESSSRQVAAA